MVFAEFIACCDWLVLIVLCTLLLGLVFSFICVNDVGLMFARIYCLWLTVFDLVCGFGACCFNWWNDFTFVGCLFNSVG